MSDNLAMSLRDQGHDRIAFTDQSLDQIGLDRARKGGEVQRPDAGGVLRYG
jgi:hypothetical protein